MTEQASTQPIAVNNNLPTIVYVLFIASYFLGGIPAIVGVALAHVNSSATDLVQRSHYSYQIRTFWWGLLWVVLGGMSTLILVGYVILVAWFGWSIYRIVKGFSALSRNEIIV